MEGLAEVRLQKVGNNYQVSHGDDTQCYVEFSNEYVLNNAKTAKEGHPIYDAVPFITIMFPGDKTKKVVRQVRLATNGVEPSDPDRWPKQWQRFQNQQQQVPDGMPLEQWASLTKPDVMSLKGSGIFTVEQLSNVPDHLLHSLGHGARMLRDKAKAWLATSNSNVEQIMRRIEALEAENQVLREQLGGRDIGSGSPAGETDVPKVTSAPKRRGRPPKVKHEPDIT